MKMYVSRWLIVGLLLTTTVVQSCTMVDVGGMKIPWDPNSEDIIIRTNSVEGSDEEVIVWFYKDNYNRAGSVKIWFKKPVQYLIGRCMGDYTPFPVSLPEQTDKTWRISFNYTELRIVLYCNEVEVLNQVVSQSICNTVNYNWRDSWEDKIPTKMKFSSTDDTATDQYCLIKKCTGLPSTLKTDATFPVDYGTVITVTCDTGYELVGSDTITCSQDTTFTSDTQPTCKQLGISSYKKLSQST